MDLGDLFSGVGELFGALGELSFFGSSKGKDNDGCIMVFVALLLIGGIGVAIHSCKKLCI